MARHTSWICLAIGFGAWVAGAWGESAPTSQPSDPATARAAAFQRFRDAKEQAKQIAMAADGVAFWQKFAADAANGPAAELAQAEIATLKPHADKNEVRFGMQWISKDELDKRNAKADELLTQAESAGDIAQAAKLFGEAAAANPHRVDIPFRNGLRLLKANKEKDALVAFGVAVAIDGQNIAAMNNQGVLLARQKQWAGAFNALARVAARMDTDLALDNLDQAMASAAEAKASTAGAEEQLRAVVEQAHRAGRRVGEARWGNTWVSEADYQAYTKENQELQKKIAANNAKLARANPTYLSKVKARETLSKVTPVATPPAGTGGTSGTGLTREQIQARLAQLDKEIRDIESKADEIKDDTKAAREKLRQPPHAGKLVLLNLDGAVGESLEPKLPADEEPDKAGGKDRPAKTGGGLFD